MTESWQSEDERQLKSMIIAHEKYPVLPNTKLAVHKMHCLKFYSIEMVRQWIREAYLEAHTLKGEYHETLPYLQTPV